MIYAFLALLIIGLIIGGSIFIVPFFSWRFYKEYMASPDQKYRTFWPRLWASCTDALVLAPITAFINYYLSLDISDWAMIRWLFVLIYVVSGYYWWAYTIGMHGRFGQTVGKKATRVKVVDNKTEEPITFRHALLRDSIPLIIITPLVVYESCHLIMGASISEFITRQDVWSDVAATAWEMWTAIVAIIWWFAEFVTMLLNKKRRAVHDFIAGTVVVRTNLEEFVQEE